MATQQPISYKSFDTTKLSFTEPKSSKLGKSAWIKYDGKQFLLQTPMMTTWGIQPKFSDFKTTVETRKEGDKLMGFSMSYQFPNEDYPNEKADIFLQKILDFEEEVKQHVIKNSQKFFGKKKSPESVLDGYYPLIKYSYKKDSKGDVIVECDENGDDQKIIDTRYGPTMRVKVPFYEGVCKAAVLDFDTQEVIYSESMAAEKNISEDEFLEMDVVPKLSSVVGILRCGGIWQGKPGWGITWKLFQAHVKKNAMSINNEVPVIVREDVDTTDITVDPNMVAPPHMGADTVKTTKEQDVVVSDSDSDLGLEDSDSDIPEPEPETETKVKTRRLNRNKTK
jgi:hypothetical protein